MLDGQPPLSSDGDRAWWHSGFDVGARVHGLAMDTGIVLEDMHSEGWPLTGSMVSCERCPYVTPHERTYIVCLGFSCRIYIDLNRRFSWLLNTTCERIHIVVRSGTLMVIPVVLLLQ